MAPTTKENSMNNTVASHILDLCEMIGRCDAIGDSAGVGEARLALEEIGFGPYCRTHDLFACPYAGNPHLPCL